MYALGIWRNYFCIMMVGYQLFVDQDLQESVVEFSKID